MNTKYYKVVMAIAASGVVALLLSALSFGPFGASAQYDAGGSSPGSGPSAPPPTPETVEGEEEEEEEEAPEVLELTEEEVEVVTEEVVVEEDGVIEEDTMISNEGMAIDLTIAAETEVTVEETGEAYTESISIPQRVSKVNLPAPLETGQKYIVAVEVKVTKPVTLSKKVAITVFAGSDMADENVLVLRYDEATGEWTEVGTAKADADGYVTFTTDHLSVFVVIKTEEGVEGEGEEEPVPFEDVEGHWSENYVNELYDQGVVSGKSPGVYEPDGALTRGELCKIALGAFGITVDTSAVADFSDVAEGDWYYSYVATAQQAGIVQGYGDGTFKPNASPNRAETLKILFVTAGVAVSEAPAADFPDVDQAAWYATYVNYAYDNGVVSGYGTGDFGPGDNVTRAEVAKMTVLTQGL